MNTEFSVGAEDRRGVQMVCATLLLWLAGCGTSEPPSVTIPDLTPMHASTSSKKSCGELNGPVKLEIVDEFNAALPMDSNTRYIGVRALDASQHLNSGNTCPDTGTLWFHSSVLATVSPSTSPQAS